jgi:hypothetical protein
MTSPHHDTLREQAGCHLHTATSLGDLQWPNRWLPSIIQYPSATPGINQHNPPQKKNRINNGTENYHTVEGAGVAESALEKGRGARRWTHAGTISKQIAGGPIATGGRPLTDVGKEQRQQTTGPSPWAPTVRRLCSIEEQTANHHYMLTGAASWWITDFVLAPGKRGKAKTQATSKQAQR